MASGASRHDDAADLPPGGRAGWLALDRHDGSRDAATALAVRAAAHAGRAAARPRSAHGLPAEAILYYDSPGYLGVYHLKLAAPDPPGYPLVARLLLDAFHNLAVLAAFNHLLGLTTAGLIYAVLLRRGVKPWMAALATGPVLLDSFQVLIEQMVMSDPLLQFLVVLGIALLLWLPRPNLATAAAAGAVFAAAALTRYVGESLVLAGLLFCVLAAGRRFVTRVVTGAALLAGFALPLTGYAAYHNHVSGTLAVPWGRSRRGSTRGWRRR